MYTPVMETALHHKVFGEGVVLSVDAGVVPPTLEVLFLTGERKLKADPVYWNDAPADIQRLVQQFSNPLTKVAERLGIDCSGKTQHEIGKLIAHRDHEVVEYNQQVATEYADGILSTEDDLLFRCPDCPDEYCVPQGTKFICPVCDRDYDLEDFSPEPITDEDGNEITSLDSGEYDNYEGLPICEESSEVFDVDEDL